MKTIGDVNVLFAVLVAWHPHHPIAWQWWQGLSDDSLGLCWLTRLAVLRLLTNTTAMNGQPLGPEKALAAWEPLALDPRTFWSEPVPAHESFFQLFVAGRKSTPNLWSDAWLAAHAKSQGYRISSFDAGFSAFSGLDFELLKA